MTPNLVIFPGCPKAEKRTPSFQSSSRATLQQRPPGNRRRHKTLARNMDRAILGDQNGRQNLVNVFVVKVTLSLPHTGGVRVMFARTFFVHVWRKCRGADCFCRQMIFIPCHALICFARSVPLGRSLNTVAFAGNSFYSIRALHYCTQAVSETVCLVFRYLLTHPNQTVFFFMKSLCICKLWYKKK